MSCGARQAAPGTPGSHGPGHLGWCGPCTILWYPGVYPPQLQTELILHHLGHLQQQLVSLRIWISRHLLTRLWIEIPRALISWIWYHVEGAIVCAIVIALWNLNLLGPLLACCLKSLIVDIRIYISMDPLNWWCYFLSRRRYVAWCAKIDHPNFAPLAVAHVVLMVQGYTISDS